MDLFKSIFQFILDVFITSVNSGFYVILGLFFVIVLVGHLLVYIFKRV